MEYLTSTETERYYLRGHRCRGAGYLRFVMLAFMCIWNYGFPEPTGFLSAVSGFAAPAYFILSGYFVLIDDKELRLKKTERKMKRSIMCFGAMFVLYLIVNVIVCLISHISVTISRRTIFNFVVLNLWPLPIGSSIWFIQALVYAYIIIYIADWLDLMKYYKVVMILCFIFMLLTGEFAGIIHFNIIGYRYIPGNWLTRALPYLLLGKFMREKSEWLFNISKSKRKKWVYIVLIIIGALLSIGEIVLLARKGCLVYQGHMIGYGIMAAAACGLALSKPKAKKTRVTYYDTALSGLVYVLIDPVYYITGLIIGRFNLEFVLYFGGMTALILCAAAAYLLRNSIIAKKLFTSRDNNSFRKSSHIEQEVKNHDRAYTVSRRH